MTDQLFDPAVAARFRANGWWRDRTYLDDFDAIVRAMPDKVAIVAHRQGSTGLPTVLSFRHLDRLVDRFAGGLMALGVEPGQVVAAQLPNDWVFAALIFACARIGAAINPLVPILRQRELRFMLSSTGAPVCIVPSVFRGFDHGAMLDKLAAELPGLAPFVLGQPATSGQAGDAASRCKSFEAHFIQRRWEEELDRPGLQARSLRADDLAEIQFTSGTTGEPKGVIHTPNTIRSGARAFPEVLGLNGDDSIIMPSTLAHQTGFLLGVILPLCWGMKVVYQDVWDAGEFCRLVEEEAVTFTAGATPFVMDTVAACRSRQRPLRSLRLFLCAGAPIPPHLVEAARNDVGCELITAWGMTENGAVTLTRPGDPPEVVSASDGIPVDWMDVRIVDDEGHSRPEGAIGRLQVRGASQAAGYYRRAELYKACLNPATDGGLAWFETGDLAWRRSDGGIRIAGRSKDLIIRGGENVPVVEVEAALYTHPKVREVAVIGYPDERLGERACAVVVAEGDVPPTLGELTAWLDQKGMAKQFWPERLELVQDMPKTPSGKIQKFELRKRLA
jgi:cyclohexanecarboxylate-CoA ligase